MQFSIGDAVVYPRHGAAKVEDVVKRTIRGEEKTYLVLKIKNGDLVIQVPIDSVKTVGIRDLIGKDEVEMVFEVLESEPSKEKIAWARRFKENVEKLSTGNIFDIAEVIRDLESHKILKGLSAGEKRMLARSRAVIVTEISLALKISEDEVSELMDKKLSAANSKFLAVWRRENSNEESKEPKESEGNE